VCVCVGGGVEGGVGGGCGGGVRTMKSLLWKRGVKEETEGTGYSHFGHYRTFLKTFILAPADSMGLERRSKNGITSHRCVLPHVFFQMN
jgi:hypothetical protein